MKKVLTTLAAVMFVAVMNVGFGSCTKKMMIIGEWEVDEMCDGDNCQDADELGWDKGTIEFEKNGDFVDDSDGKEAEGTWKVDDETLTFKFDNGVKVKYRIKKLTKNEMELKSKDNGITLYLKRA